MLDVAASAVRLAFANTAGAGAIFHVRSGEAGDAPRSYTVEAGKRLVDDRPVASDYDLAVYGPNGFLHAQRAIGSVRKTATAEARRPACPFRLSAAAVDSSTSAALRCVAWSSSDTAWLT